MILFHGLRPSALQFGNLTKFFFFFCSGGSKTFNVFVGDLKSEVTENDLVAAFSACGPIASSHIIRDRQTGEQRGYGFVHFKTLSGQQSALKAPYSSMEIKGRPVRVRPADDKTVLWVSSLPNDLNENEAREALSALLPSNIAMAHFELKTGPPPLYQSRGFAFVSFETHEAADQARRIFAKGVLKGRQLNVSWAEPQSEVDEQVMGKVTTLYVSNIHLAVTDDQLRALFSQFGDVKNCVIVKSQQSRESRGFAFVEFHVRLPRSFFLDFLFLSFHYALLESLLLWLSGSTTVFPVAVGKSVLIVREIEWGIWVDFVSDCCYRGHLRLLSSILPPMPRNLSTLYSLIQ
jgi:RNA recognition motif-containing protein